MTKEEWATVERALNFAYGAADLRVDGFEVALRVERIRKLQYTIVVYVNGSWKGTWLRTDCEERRRFFRPVRRCLMSRKHYDAWRKSFGKKRADAERAKASGTFWLPDWTSFGALRRHLVKNNTSIELVKA